MNENPLPHEPLPEKFDTFSAGWVRRAIPEERPKPYESSRGIPDPPPRDSAGRFVASLVIFTFILILLFSAIKVMLP